MKVLVVGDLHFRPELPYATALDDGRRGEWGDTLATIAQHADRADAVVLMGDNLNTRHNNSTVIKEFVEFLKSLGNRPIHILVGNHERYGDSTALDFLERMEHPLWTVYTTPVQGVDVCGTPMTFVPYMTRWMVGDGKDDKEAVTKLMSTLSPAEVGFFHQGITGAVTHGSMVDLFNELVFPLETLEALYGKVFSGHIHQHQTIGTKTQMTGSVFSMEVGDHTKQVYLYDTASKKTEAIPLPVRGIFSIQNEEVGREDIPASSIVKCTITKKDAFDITVVKDQLGKYDAYVLIEQYPSERRKVHLEQANMDLDIHSLLRVYAKARNVEYNILKEGLDLLQNS